jgi:hypothetical protein
MTEKQMQKWVIIRQKGQTSYLVKRTLLWGTLLSIVKMAGSFFFTYFISAPAFSFIFGKEYTFYVEDIVMDLFLKGIGCYLLAGVIALAVWTFKERCSFSGKATF